MNIKNLKPRVLLVNSAIYLPGEGGHKRSLYLFEMMKNMGYEVTLLTSTFNHYAKRKRDINRFREEFPSYSGIQFIDVPTYEKNISIKRIISEKVWTHRFIEWYRTHAKDYDIVYHNMPAMNTIIKANPISKKFGVKTIIDVRDLRPEVFKTIIKNDYLYRMLTYPMKLKANKAYSCADLMFAVSEEYLQRGMSVNTKAIDSKAIYIGSILEKFYDGIEKYCSSIEKNTDEKWITYAGTIGNTYDLYTLMDVAYELQQIGYSNLRFKIIGQGPLENDLKAYVSSKGINIVDFVGFLPYEVMAAYLSKSDITINSLKARASQSIINKVADYFAAGIPILNGSLCNEMKMLVEENKLGLNFEPENVTSLKDAIITLLNNPKLCKIYGENARRIAEEKFNRSNSYIEIINRIDLLHSTTIK